MKSMLKIHGEDSIFLIISQTSLNEHQHQLYFSINAVKDEKNVVF